MNRRSILTLLLSLLPARLVAKPVVGDAGYPPIPGPLPPPPSAPAPPPLGCPMCFGSLSDDGYVPPPGEYTITAIDVIEEIDGGHIRGMKRRRFGLTRQDGLAVSVETTSGLGDVGEHVTWMPNPKGGILRRSWSLEYDLDQLRGW